MKCKLLILILLSLVYSIAQGQSEVVINFYKSAKVINTKDFRFSIQTSSDTISVFNLSDLDGYIRKTSAVSTTSKVLKGVFEFTSDQNVWEVVEYELDVDTNDLKRIEIQLIFGSNDSSMEFLQDFTVDKIYNTNQVSIHVDELEIGKSPLFILENHSDFELWGASMTNHFYGSIKRKTESGWDKFSGSYCLSTVHIKPINKSEKAYSWVPNYSPSDVYKLTTSGHYKYIVALGLERYTQGILKTKIDTGQTRKRHRTFFEVEKEFTIK